MLNLAPCMKWNCTNDQRISLKTMICTIPEPEPETRTFWSNPTRTRPEVKEPYSSWPGHHQHGGQVDTQGCLKEDGLEEGGGVSDHHEEERGEVGGHHLAQDLSLHINCHFDSLSGLIYIDQHLISDTEKCHIFCLLQNQVKWKKSDTLVVARVNTHFDRTVLKNRTKRFFRRVIHPLSCSNLMIQNRSFF